MIVWVGVLSAQRDNLNESRIRKKFCKNNKRGLQASGPTVKLQIEMFFTLYNVRNKLACVADVNRQGVGEAKIPLPPPCFHSRSSSPSPPFYAYYAGEKQTKCKNQLQHKIISLSLTMSRKAASFAMGIVVYSFKQLKTK